MPQSLGALGGKPNNAYYFIGFLGKKRGITSKSSWVKGGWAEVCMGDQAIPVTGPLSSWDMLWPLVGSFCLRSDIWRATLLCS